MAKKKGLFSWFRKDKEKVTTPSENSDVTQDEDINGEALEQAKAQAAEKNHLEEQAKAEANEKARLEEQAKTEAAEKARLEELAKAEAAEKTRLEELAKAEAAEKARLEELAKAEADEKTRFEELAKAEAAEKARLEELAKAEADEKTRFEELAQTSTVEEPAKRPGLFARLRRGLKRTRGNIGSGFLSLFRGKKIDDDLFEELEEQLLIADVGVATTQKIIKHLTDTTSRRNLKDGEALYELLQEQMGNMLSEVEQPLQPSTDGPFVILMVGVNGVGKTTTIGKLAKQFQEQEKSVMLAAGDTFRAAAVEQLQVWGERNHIPVIAQHTGADSASVLFDAYSAAKARNIDILIADTAGRLQNKANLMEELKKIVRVMKKIDENAPHEIMLTIDAGTGQNAISQAKLFNEAIGLTGITLTKLDGTAKGGVIFAVADQFKLPIRYIGVGEGIDDLRPFESQPFVEALFTQEQD